MTKYEYAEIIVRSPAWDGVRSADRLARMYPKNYLKDIYDMLDDAEADYYG